MFSKVIFSLLVTFLLVPLIECRIPNVAFAAGSRKIQVGDKMPSSELHWGFNPPQFINLPMYLQSRNVLVVGVKGAYLPESETIVRSYIEHSHSLKKYYNLDEVVVFAINDGGVMGTWQKSLKTSGSIVTCFADPSGEFAKLCGMSLIDETELGLVGRCPIFVLHSDGCIVKYVQECTDGDNLETVCAPTLMNILKQQRATVQ